MKSVLALSVMAMCGSSVLGSPILSFEPQNVAVAPGTTSQFEVRLAGTTNLAGFYFELGLAPQAGATGAVAFMGASGDQDSRYCFYGFNDLFQASVIGDTILVAGDMTDPPEIEVSTVAGVNDLLAIVEISASADASGTFDLSFDQSVLELFDQYGDPIPEFDQTTIDDATVIVPEPASLFLLVFWGLCTLGLRSRTPRMT